jgi:catechol 2,3-dioxygenase-like lactoylglutathione lyase family enzyme
VDGKLARMIDGAHVLLFSADAEADRIFFRDALGLKSVDAGHGWLIFALPPAEAAVHPSEQSNRQDKRPMLAAELYFMCDDLNATVKMLKDKNVTCGPVSEERWGTKTTIRLPGGGEVGLYQPKHPTALDLGSK